MLNLIKGFVLGFLVACGALIAGAYTHHVVRTQDGFKVVAKSPGSLDKIYVDTRNWGPIDYVTNRDVMLALAKAGYDQSRQRAQESLKSGRETVEKSLAEARRDIEEMMKTKP